MSAIQESRPDTVLAGIGWMVLTTLLFVCVTGIVRHVGTDVAAVEAAFIRYAFGVVLLLPLMGSVLRRRPSRRWLAIFIVRGVVHGVAVSLWFFAMAHIPIAEVTALGYVAPIFVTIGAAVFFSERLHLRRIAAVVAALLGTMVILRPGFEEISVGQLASLGSAPLFAVSFLLAKRLTDGEEPLIIVGMLSIFCTLTLLPGTAQLDHARPARDFLARPDGVFATLGHYTMTRAIRAAPLTVTQPVGFLQLVWATLVGIALFGEQVDPFVLLGGGLVVAAVTFISHREAVAARSATTSPEVATRL